MALPFIGPSYALDSRTHGVQRTVNLIPVQLESGTERTQWAYQDLPGLTQFADLSASGECRGAITVLGRNFQCVGSTLYELFSDGTSTSLGTIGTSAGPVDFASNRVHLVVVDGSGMYCWSLAGGTVTYVTTAGARVAFINQYLLTTDPNTEQFKWSDVGDATTWDALSFASAEGAPDNLVGVLVDHLDVKLLGTTSVETWVNTGSSSVFERDGGRYVEHGCAAPFSAQKIANTFMWLGSDERGSLAVFMDAGGQPTRVSTRFVEQKLNGIDVSEARAYTYVQDGLPFYCLNVPGVDTTLVYEVGSKQWHERAELVDGDYTQHRAVCHSFAFNKHLVGSSSGKLYYFDNTKSNNAGDVLVRDRICPDRAMPSRQLIRYPFFALDCERGHGGKVLLRYSNDGGRNYGSWLERSLGELGDFKPQVQFDRCGAARDRVWHVRVTDDVPFNPVGAVDA